MFKNLFYFFYLPGGQWYLPKFFKVRMFCVLT